MLNWFIFRTCSTFSPTLSYKLLPVLIFCPDYREKYAKPEDVGAAPEEKSSDEEELSEDEYDSSDEAVAGQADP